MRCLLLLLTFTFLVVTHEAARAQYYPYPPPYYAPGYYPPAYYRPPPPPPGRLHVSGRTALLWCSALLQFGELRDAISIQAMLSLTRSAEP